jgi:hypothetical protein
MAVQRDAQATGRGRFFALALRGWTLWEWSGRRPVAAEGTQRAGLDAGKPQRTTDRPTAARLLAAGADMPLTISKGSPQTAR